MPRTWFTIPTLRKQWNVVSMPIVTSREAKSSCVPFIVSFSMARIFAGFLLRYLHLHLNHFKSLFAPLQHPQCSSEDVQTRHSFSNHALDLRLQESPAKEITALSFKPAPLRMYRIVRPFSHPSQNNESLFPRYSQTVRREGPPRIFSVMTWRLIEEGGTNFDKLRFGKGYRCRGGSIWRIFLY